MVLQTYDILIKNLYPFGYGLIIQRVFSSVLDSILSIASANRSTMSEIMYRRQDGDEIIEVSPSRAINSETF